MSEKEQRWGAKTVQDLGTRSTSSRDALDLRVTEAFGAVRG